MVELIIIIIIIIKNDKIRVTLCENTAGALYIVNNGVRGRGRPRRRWMDGRHKRLDWIISSGVCQEST